MSEASPPDEKVKKVNWSKVKVFDKPVLRLPFRLAKYSKGRGAAWGDPELWLQAGIESGLVVMEEPKEGEHAPSWLEVIDREAYQPLKPGELQELVNEGIRNNLKALESIDFSAPPGPQDWEGKAREKEGREESGGQGAKEGGQEDRKEEVGQ